MSKAKMILIFLGILAVVAVGFYVYIQIREWQHERLLDAYRHEGYELITYSDTMKGRLIRATTEKDALLAMNEELQGEVGKKDKELKFYVELVAALEEETYSGTAPLVGHEEDTYTYGVDEPAYYGNIDVASTIEPIKVSYTITVRGKTIDLDVAIVWNKKLKQYEAIVVSKTPGVTIENIEARFVPKEPSFWENIVYGAYGGYYHGPMLSGVLGYKITPGLAIRAQVIGGYSKTEFDPYEQQLEYAPAWGAAVGIGN